MKRHSASYNFPPDFLWGIIPYEGFSSDKENYSYIFDLQEKHIKAVLINVSRAACEPLKGNYNEEYIETLRTILSRIHGRNISPVVILNTNDTPGWQNLDHPGKNDFSDEYNFMAHIAETLCPYTKYFGLLCPEGSIVKRSGQGAKQELLSEVSTHIRSLSEDIRTILVLNSLLSAKDEWLNRIRYRFIKNIDTDYLGVDADENTFGTIQDLFGDERKPLMILSDGLKKEQPERRAEKLADKLYSAWRFYQTGWPLLSFFSESDITNRTNDSVLYENSCSKNAFEIANDMSYLPGKWLEFMKD